MKIQFFSDTHREFHMDRGKDLIESLLRSQIVKPDVLVVAGDYVQISAFKDVLGVFRDLLQLAPEIIYVPGNHEYYASSAQNTIIELDKIQKEFKNIHVLRTGEICVIDDKRFLGGTMWFGEPKDPREIKAKRQMADFNRISSFEPWAYEENYKFNTFLHKNLREGDIVVTHHLPSPRSTPEFFKNSPVNAFYVCDQTKLITERSPAVWIHGHTHRSFDYRIGNTRILCNPHGCPGEWRAFNEFRFNAVVEL